MYCDLDLINRCCWTHGVDISEVDYVEGCCWKGNPEYTDDDEDFIYEEDND